MIRTLYQSIAKPIFFRFDPEWIHETILHTLPLIGPLKPVMQNQFSFNDGRLKQTIWGLDFNTPIGLAGGFDKNARCVNLWDAFGFSFFEIGTVTPKPQPGNPKPRLFRYPHREALINRMGFNNDGSEVIAERLQHLAALPHRALMGVSLGKQFDTPVDDLDQVVDDYCTSLKRLHDYGDFFVVNVSSPNTKNLRELQQKESLQAILNALKMELQTKDKAKPLCVKFAPDLSEEQINEAVSAALECGIDGFIATNTTNQTGETESGGLSGKPLRERATEVVKLIAHITEGNVPIIGCGGILDAPDAIEKLEAGAWALQIYTGFVYRGPGVVYDLNCGILNEMDKRGFTHLSDFRKG
ncbi:MAG: quinone-dependent dihydroorotate dehydrogenase [Candidatus Hinthialibacter antarcticus]|nr:quinone-dependent dihydroorotate dehydrogenase [Candidatus Hinthialibacter antarcticus]